MTVKRKVVPTGLPAITRSTSDGVRTGRPSTATITSVCWRLFAAGKPGCTAATSAPFCDGRDLLAERPQRDGRGDLLRRPHLGRVHLILLRGGDAGRDDLVLRVEVGARVEAAEQLLEQRRLADDHVDEVDAAAARRVVAARDLDERRDRMGLVGQEDVVARGDQLEREHAQHEHRAERQGRDRAEDAPQPDGGGAGGERPLPHHHCTPSQAGFAALPSTPTTSRTAAAEASSCASLGVAEVELDDLLDAACAELHRHADVEAVDAVLALEIRGAGQDPLLVEHDRVDHLRPPRRRVRTRRTCRGG